VGSGRDQHWRYPPDKRDPDDSNGHSYGAPFDLAVDASMTFNYISNPAADVMNTVTRWHRFAR
jgi:hypothetical protein